MTDEVDISNDNIQHDLERRVEEVRRNAEYRGQAQTVIQRIAVLED